VNRVIIEPIIEMIIRLGFCFWKVPKEVDMAKKHIKKVRTSCAERIP
jgi:hypothetical protein